MASRTGLRLASLLLALSLPTLQTPTTHVVTKTITAGELGATILPSGTGYAINPIIEINVPPLPMAPSSTVTITTTLTIDDPNSSTLFSFKATLIALLVPLLCSLVVVAYKRGYRARLFKQPVKAAASKANPPAYKPADRSSQGKQTEQPKQSSSEPKPSEPPRSTSYSPPRFKPPMTYEELKQKEREEALRLERDAYHWGSLFKSPTLDKPKPQAPAPAPKKKVTFAKQGDDDVRSSSNQGSSRTGSKGPKATINIYK